jgi:hypothetical protein
MAGNGAAPGLQSHFSANHGQPELAAAKFPTT